MHSMFLVFLALVALLPASKIIFITIPTPPWRTSIDEPLLLSDGSYGILGILKNIRKIAEKM